jgi:hypothetical protein
VRFGKTGAGLQTRGGVKHCRIVEDVIRKKTSPNHHGGPYREIKTGSVLSAVENDDPEVARFVTDMLAAAGKSIAETSVGSAGDLSVEQIAHGRTLLKRIKGSVSLPVSSTGVMLVEEYYETIPTKLYRVKGRADMDSAIKRLIGKNYSDELERLNQLEAASVSSNVTTSKVEDVTGATWRRVTADEKSKLQEYITRSATSQYGSGRNTTTVDIAFAVDSAADEYDANIGNVMLNAIHGTKYQFLAHIVRQGLRVPGRGAPGLFGGGMYFADSVTKSLGYVGGNRTIILLAEVALGRQHETNEKKAWVPDGFDSIFCGVARNSKTIWGGGLRMAEYVVYRPEQAKLRHVLVMR